MKILVINSMLEQKHVDLIKKLPAMLAHTFSSIIMNLKFHSHILMLTSSTALRLQS